MSTARKIILVSSDNEEFEVDESIALESETIKLMINDNSDDHIIPVPNAPSRVLAMVVEHCKLEVAGAPANCEEKRRWEADYMDIDQKTLYDLITASNYLNIRSLLDLTCKTAAEMIKGETTEDIRSMFEIKNDFTREEEEEYIREHRWAFE